MKNRYLIIALLLFFSFADVLSSSPFRYVGGDISLLPDYEKADAKYYDKDGKPVSDLLKFCYEEGMNCMRVRLFVTPGNYTGPEADPNAKQDLEYIIPLCRRIQEDGFALILDFHYSDTWADPGKQWTPKEWETLSDEELYDKIYDYTKETLKTLGENGVVPEFIQPGNEISYGMLWGAAGTDNPKKVDTGSDRNWDRFHQLLRNAIKACREECPAGKIIIHTERVADPLYLIGFYNRLNNYDLDYDIIGLSYYPYFHGSISVLNEALKVLEANFDKDIMIVETGYPYAWEVPGTNKPVDYPYTEEGQYEFAKDLVTTLLKYERCTGVLWWWLEYNAKGTTLSGWYNAPLFDSRTGKVTKAFAEICSFGSGHSNSAVFPVPAASKGSSHSWYNLNGKMISHPNTPGIYIRDGMKVIRR